MPEIIQRDATEVADALARWLSTRLSPGADPKVAEVEAPLSTGFSNETILCRATWSADHERAEHRIVVRVAPTKHLLFLDADFAVQYKVMRALSDGGSDVPLPPLRWYEPDDSWLGAPFFLMDHVEGTVAGEPTYDNAWLTEASAECQERLWWSGLEAMAAVHRTDWRALDLGWLADPARGAPGVAQQLAYYRDYLDWAAKGPTHPFIEAVWDWLLAHRPADRGALGLCWGDSRIGNIIWQDFRPGAVIDWEMATLAQPELDLGWWLYFDRQFSTGLMDAPRARPSGFPTPEATIEAYAELVGRPMADLGWYEVFAGFRFAVIFVRLTDLIKGSGLLPEESDMATNNLATQCLAQMLDLDPPASWD